MKKYVVWFEAFGKKLRTTVEAENEYKAMDAVKNKIIFLPPNGLHVQFLLPHVPFARILRGSYGYIPAKSPPHHQTGCFRPD